MTQVVHDTKPVVVWFESYWPGLKSEVGGKASSLGEMTGAGMPVPPGFAITTEAYRRTRDSADLDATLARLLHGLDESDTDAVTAACAAVRAEMATMVVPGEVEKEIRQAYDNLCGRSGTPDVPVAVRSSATSEDSAEASFAGEHDTYLWVRGGDAVIGAVRRCWASLFTDRATTYRTRMGFEHRAVQMCVVVQKMVHPVAAGVAFSLNPVDGDRSQVVIDAAWGFGESVVSGEVTPDNFCVDKVLLEITKRTISTKECEFVLTDHDSVERMELKGPRATSTCLTDDQIRGIAKMAKSAEKHYGCPQDIEWAVDADLPAGEQIILLQSRPETVWSRKPVKPVAAAGDYDFMASIVRTLMSPLHTKSGGVGGKN